MAEICFQSLLEKQGPDLDRSSLDLPPWLQHPALCHHPARGREGREVGWRGGGGLSAGHHPADSSQDVLQLSPAVLQVRSQQRTVAGAMASNSEKINIAP